jgi:hypothetical protein
VTPCCQQYELPALAVRLHRAPAFVVAAHCWEAVLGAEVGVPRPAEVRGIGADGSGESLKTGGRQIEHGWYRADASLSVIAI